MLHSKILDYSQITRIRFYVNLDLGSDEHVPTPDHSGECEATVAAPGAVHCHPRGILNHTSQLTEKERGNAMPSKRDISGDIM